MNHSDTSIQKNIRKYASIGCDKQHNTSDDDEEENSLYDKFTQVFDGMGENGDDKQQHLFYDNLISLNEKNYIVFEDSSYTLVDDIVYRFDSLEISEKERNMHGNI